VSRGSLSDASEKTCERMAQGRVQRPRTGFARRSPSSADSCRARGDLHYRSVLRRGQETCAERDEARRPAPSATRPGDLRRARPTAISISPISLSYPSSNGRWRHPIAVFAFLEKQYEWGVVLCTVSGILHTRVGFSRVCRPVLFGRWGARMARLCLICWICLHAESSSRRDKLGRGVHQEKVQGSR
jgi:hypothetical protein